MNVIAETARGSRLPPSRASIIEYFTADDPEHADDTFARFVDEFLLALFEPADQPYEGNPLTDNDIQLSSERAADLLCLVSLR
jgi:hypothetical protein